MRTWVFIAIVAAVPAADAVDYPSRPPEQTMDAHDPAVLKDGGYFYVYGTHNMPTWRSRDLIDFELVDRRLVPEPPGEARTHVGEKAKDMWAPDMIKAGNEYRLYYCLSRFGTSRSYIGFMTGKSPTGPFRDNTEVTRSTDPLETAGAPNALDPSILVDDDDNCWMVYGSFFGGIYMMRLDADGEARRRNSVGERMAYRRNTALEGPCILYHPELKKYFLFVSYDSLNSTYNVRVGRSSRPDGPYRDFNGKDMAGEEDNLPKILNSYAFENDAGWHGPGHNSVLRDGDDFFMLHHARVIINGRKRVRTHVRRMVFTDEGWPVVSPERYAGEQEESMPESEILGQWEYLLIDPDDNDMQQAVQGLVFEKGGVLKLGDKSGKWQIKPPNSLRFRLENEPQVSAKILPAWDWENGGGTLVFTGLNRDGTAAWGKRRNRD